MAARLGVVVLPDAALPLDDFFYFLDLFRVLVRVPYGVIAVIVIGKFICLLCVVKPFCHLSTAIPIGYACLLYTSDAADEL